MARTSIAGLGAYDSLRVALRRALRANGVMLVAADKAGAILRVTRNERGRRVLSVGPQGTVQEYELYRVVGFEVAGQGKHKRLKLANQRITLTRDYVFDEDRVLGSAQEEDVLYEQMQKNLIRQILYRLEAAG